MAHAHKSFGQRMLQKAADKLDAWQAHLFPFAIRFVVSITETDKAVFYIQNAPVANGNPVDVASQVIQRLRRIAERGFGIHLPLLGLRCGYQLLKYGWVCQIGTSTGESQFFFCQTASSRPRKTNRGIVPTIQRWETRSQGRPLPLFAVASQCAAGDKAMQMEMFGQGLTPGVQNGRKADFAAQVLPSKGFERVRRAGKEQMVYLFPIHPRQWIEEMVNGEDDVEVVGGQQMRFLLFQPCQLG